MHPMQNALRFSLIIAIFLITSETGFSQKFNLTGYDIPIELPSSLPQCKDYSTYDFTFVSVIAGAQKELNNFDLPYETKFSNYTRTPNQGDFHVIAKLFKFSGGLTSKSTANVAINLTIKIFDKNGKAVGEEWLTRDAFFISMGRYFNTDEMNNAKILSTAIIQNSLDTLFSYFTKNINGSKFKTEILFASVGGVKKLPELEEFSDRLKLIAKASTKGTAAEFNTALESNIPFWEKMTAYAGEGDVDDVKRAAYHNLAIYHILTGKLDKATEYIEKYKLIDKPYSLFLGLNKMRYSEVWERKLKAYYPNYEKSKITNTSNTKIITKEELVDVEKFLTINGSVVLKGKLHPGTFTGITKKTRYNTPPPNFVAPLIIDKPNDDLFFEGKDETGKVVKFSTSSDDIVIAKDNNGDSFIKKSVGGIFGIGGQNSLMKSSYTSTKVTVYRNYFQEMEDYFIIKTGDTEGYKSVDSKSRKKLAEYLSDCADLATKIKEKTISENEKIEKIAALYTDCK
jgi:hypothetical protein